ncbi:zwei Ig domain protein zig-8-like [Cherax quadricarinatus]|uniref:zwei Ig domain protein zig-8-like n=1 Tax=Cherax quadricarinatus TaxID=27406 RepID=UPI00387E738A
MTLMVGMAVWHSWWVWHYGTHGECGRMALMVGMAVWHSWWVRHYDTHGGYAIMALMVTWMKRDEDQLLTAGGQVYSSEARYSVAHVRHQKMWELSLRDVRRSDAGLYECQVTTHPPTSLFFTLKVVEARAVIQGAPEMHVHTGVRLRLHCGVEQATEPPAFIFWYHNGTMVNYDPRRALKVVRHQLASSLVVHNVTWGDAGAYTCDPDKATPANITLHVIAEEKHAALHNGHSDESEHLTAAHSPPSLASPLLVGSLFILLMDTYFQKINMLSR